MQILLANPNTTQAVTDAMASAARAAASPGTTIKAVTARFGAAIIGTRTEAAIAQHAALELVARESVDCDAVIIGASLDSALHAAREMLGVPVLGLTESALHIACLTGMRFGAVTTSGRSAAGLREMIELYGFTARCAGVGTLDTTPQQILADPAGLAKAITAASQALVDSGADAVVLIGAVMAGMPARVQPDIPVPVLEGVACAVGLAETLVRMRLPKPRAGSFAGLPARPQIGLDPALAARFAG
jgi:allantoin racemase